MDLTEEDCLNLSNNVSLHGEKDSGLIWDELTKKRIKSPLALEPYGYKVYSQNDEDGIIDEIFKRIGVVQKKFIEIGVENGLECNTHFLLFKGWSGLWIEGNPKYVKEINNKFSPVIKNNKLHVENEFLTKQNINSVISRYFSNNEEIDLLSIDIDGNDYYIWEEISSVNPRVVVVEYNGKFPPDIEWCQAYNAEHVWNSSDWQGASLLSFEKLAQKKGYTLVGTNIRGVNAFFVRDDLINGKFLKGNSVYFYNPFRYHLSFYTSPSSYCLIDQKENYGLLNYYNYEIVSGFYNSENGYHWIKDRISKLRIKVPKNKNIIIIPFEYPFDLYERQQEFSFDVVLSHENLTSLTNIKFVNNLFGEIKLSLTPQNKECIVNVEFSLPCLFHKYNSKDSRLFGIRLNMNSLTVK